MKYITWSIVLRWLLTAGVLFMVYRETGIWTVVGLSLMSTGTELDVFFRWKYRRHEKSVNSRLEQLLKKQGIEP